MIKQERIKAIAPRLIGVRARLLSTHPFFGKLLLHLQLGFSECGTAFTDMKRVVFDPEFAEKLSEGELRFVFLHELMHCVLHHCTRGRSLRPHLYNIACDIVVNSLIMETLGVHEYVIDGEEVMHLVPNGNEGRLYSAEEVYDMLLKASPEEIQKQYGKSGFDKHIIWEQILDSMSDDEWDQYIKEAASIAGSGTGIPYSFGRYLKDISHTPKTNWRQLLHDFIQHDGSDYIYSVPDHRFQGDFIMPSFQENVYGDKVDKLWFLIDTSGSISDDALSEAFHEVKDAVEQIDNLSGELSFFDTEVSEPEQFESVDDLISIKPIGGGGTSFRAIFKFMEDHYEDDLPTAVIILTDGYADFPEEDAACGLPVMWIIIDSDVETPWGECIHIER